MRLSVLLSIIISLLFGTFFWMAKDLLVELFDIEPLKDFILFIPFAMLFAVLLQLAMQWLIRMKEFRLIARSAVIHSLILNVAKVGVGLLYPFGVALIAVATMGYALHAALLAGSAIFAFARSHRDESASSPLSPFRAARKYIDFPLYRAPQSFISDLSQGLPILLLSGLFGPVAAGYYAISKMSMGVPSVLVGKALRDVLYPHLAEAFRNGECLYRPLVRSTTLLAFIGALPFGVVVFYGPLLFSWIFGSEWVAAGEYARWLAIFFYFNLINKPSFAAVPVLGLQKELLLYEIGSIALKALGLFAGFFVFESDLWAVALFSMFGAASYVFMIFWVAFRSKVK
ncbi:polysaccharide biosynthesis protein [Thauera sp. 27]|nr:polysaccharide biosynthesis protein [Thauera sp. 27]